MNSRTRATSIIGSVGLLVVVQAFLLFAAEPPIRQEVNLAGSWGDGGTVPNYRRGTSFDTRTFQRSVSVPSNWTGKRIFLEIETLNWGDVTTVDGTEVGRSTGGWLPHSYDITSRVTPGQTHTVAMQVTGTPPGGWPTSYHGFAANADGLVYDIFLRAYGTVAIRDAEIITSVTNKSITVKYDIQNFAATSKSIAVNASIFPSTGGTSALTLTTASTTLASGEKKTISATSSWTNPNLWFPTNPNLYHLCSSVKESGATIDSQTVRFGFREMTISGRYLKLNGVRVNFRGESMDPSHNAAYPGNAADMRAWITKEKAVNANSLRFHVKPAANALLAECDEMGLMIMAEAPLWQRADECGSSQTLNTWIPAWVKSQRNHASVVHWSAENECYGLSEQTALAMNRAINGSDGNLRPVWHEDVNHGALPTACKHYPEGYQNLPNSGNMYNTDWISSSKPQSSGEFLACCWGGSSPTPDVYYWQGIYSRAQRYNNVSVIHNYNYYGIGTTNNGSHPAAWTLLTTSYAPVALFDYEYDRIGIGPIKDNSYPSIVAGSTANRTLVLYNDEFTDEMVMVTMEIKSGTTTYATITKGYNVTLGEHVEFPCSFQAPYVGGSTMDMVLTTRKNGATKFSEIRRFTVTGASSGTSSNIITLGGGGIDPTTPYMQISPAGIDMSGAMGTNISGQTIAATNIGGGTLGTLSTNVTYGPGASNWVTATPGGSGNNRSIALTYNTSLIGGGSYTAYLVIKSQGASPDSIVCRITLSQTGPDLSPPSIVRVSGTANTVVVVFSEKIEGITSTTTSNYTIEPGVTISQAMRGVDEASITLTTSALANNTTYTLKVNNIKDLAAPSNKIPDNTTVTFTALRTVTKIRFYPRPDMSAARMNGGRFEGTQGAIDGQYITLHTITSNPADNQWTEVTSLQNASQGFSAVRYYSPSGFGNISELEFYSGDVKLAGTPYGTPGTWGGSDADFTKAFDGNTSTYFDCSQSEAFTGIVLLDTPVRDHRDNLSNSRGRHIVLHVVYGRTNLSLPLNSVAGGGAMNVSLYNLRGSLVTAVTADARGTASVRLDLDEATFPQGRYIVHVKAGDQSSMKRINIIR